MNDGEVKLVKKKRKLEMSGGKTKRTSHRLGG